MDNIFNTGRPDGPLDETQLTQEELEQLEKARDELAELLVAAIDEELRLAEEEGRLPHWIQPEIEGLFDRQIHIQYKKGPDLQK